MTNARNGQMTMLCVCVCSCEYEYSAIVLCVHEKENNDYLDVESIDIHKTRCYIFYIQYGSAKMNSLIQ